MPSATFKYFDSEGNMKEISTEGICKGKKVSDGSLAACAPGVVKCLLAMHAPSSRMGGGGGAPQCLRHSHPHAA